MGLSYIWCNFTKVTPLLDHRFPIDLMVKITLLGMLALNIYCLPNQLIYSILSFIFLSSLINYNSQSRGDISLPWMHRRDLFLMNLISNHY